MNDGVLSRTVLAISAFRSDEAVLRLLESAFERETTPFGGVIVVDSLGSGRIAEEAKARGWPVHYENASTNLGSAGNLARRLELAAATGLDWCLALNHDAALDIAKAAALVDCGDRQGRAGVIYPQLRLTSAGTSGRFDKPRRRFTLFGITARHPLSPAAPVRVAWGSSNGALYGLNAVRSLDRLWADLWMGYEDLALGWEVERSGWTQWLCPAVIVDDNYEFRSVGSGVVALNTADKPAWYSYYQSRNVLLIARRSAWKAIGPFALLGRLVADLGLILFVRAEKKRRFDLWWAGVRAGLADRDGHGPVP